MIDWLVDGQTSPLQRTSGTGTFYTMGSSHSVQLKVNGLVRRVLGLRAKLIFSGTEQYDFSLWDSSGALHETKSITDSVDGIYAITFTSPFQPLFMRIFTIGLTNRTNAFYMRVASPSVNITTSVCGGVKVEFQQQWAQPPGSPGVNQIAKPTTAGSEACPLEIVWEQW